MGGIDGNLQFLLGPNAEGGLFFGRTGEATLGKEQYRAYLKARKPYALVQLHLLDDLAQLGAEPRAVQVLAGARFRERLDREWLSSESAKLATALGSAEGAAIEAGARAAGITLTLGAPATWMLRANRPKKRLVLEYGVEVPAKAHAVLAALLPKLSGRERIDHEQQSASKVKQVKSALFAVEVAAAGPGPMALACTPQPSAELDEALAGLRSAPPPELVKTKVGLDALVAEFFLSER